MRTAESVGFVLLLSSAALLLLPAFELESLLVLAHSHERCIFALLLLFDAALLFLEVALFEVFEGFLTAHLDHAGSVGLDDVVGLFRPGLLA